MMCRLSPKSHRSWTVASWIFSVALLLMLATDSAHTQIATASLNGTVTDPSGAVIPGATVSLKNVATNVERTTSTNSAGNYVLVNINPGRYTLTVHKDGFSTVSQPEFPLEVNQTSTLDFSLHVGSAVESVTVEAAEAGLQTSTHTAPQSHSGRKCCEHLAEWRQPAIRRKYGRILFLSVH